MPTIQGYANEELDRSYAQVTASAFRQIRALVDARNGRMQRALRAFQDEVEALDEAGEPLTIDNAELLAVFSAFGDVMDNTELILASIDEDVQMSGAQIAVPAVTASIFGVLAAALARADRNPVSPSAMQYYEQEIIGGGLNYVTLDDRALQIATDYVRSDAWQQRLSGWGDGYANLLEDTIINGIRNRQNPLTTALDVRRLTEGIPTHASDNLMRTLQLTAYREAEVAQVMANNQFIVKKYRIAALDSRTCFPENTVVKTIDGDKYIQDIDAGEYVLTHTGQYRKVNEILKRMYSKDMVKLSGSFGELECTSDHPILIKRGGYCYWEIAERIDSGDEVFIFTENGSHDLNHITSDVTIKWRIRNADDKITGVVEPLRFSGVGSWAFGMPINPIDFKSKIQSWNEKIDSISVNFRLLVKRFFNGLEAKPDILFWFGLASILMIATGTTEYLIPAKWAGTNAKIFTAVQAGFYQRWTTAFLATIMACMFGAVNKFLPAPFANQTVRRSVDVSAFNTAVVVPMSVGLRNSKRFTTTNTSFINAGRFQFTLNRTVIKLSSLFNFGWTKLKYISAMLTDILGSVSLLPNSVTSLGTSDLSPSLKLGFEDSNILPASLAGHCNSFTTHIITSSNISKRNYNAFVYNLEVDEDNTYIANGVVVHNCLTCVALHGTELELDQRVDDHYGGRCSAVYQVEGGDPPVKQTGEQWFAGLSEDRQRQQASFRRSPGKYNAYQSGVPLSEFVGTHQDSVFGNQVIEQSMTQALGDGASQYYARNQGA